MVDCSGYLRAMNRIVLVLIALLLTAGVLTAAFATNIRNPLASSKSDYSANFSQNLSGAGWAPIDPIAQTGDNVYSGSYRASSGNSNGNGNVILTVTVEIAQSEAAAKERYGQLVSEKQNDGYTSGISGLGNSTIFGSPAASWFGYSTNSTLSASMNASTNASTSASTYTFLYAHDKEIGNWIVVAETTDTSG